ncbi:hypothetical protein [Microbulbifer sp. ZKSA002]|uniref:hypothetical protein n=1 Tax=Microbulbifer sp. ZKSA002 TaxID=3243388 RepID=UPI004039F6D6
MNNSEYFKAEEYGFSYPKEYNELISNTGEFGELKWWFIGSSSGLFSIAYELFNKELNSSIEFFPFAKSSETNAVACFDKNGKVYIVIGNNSLKKVDWGKRLTQPNIIAWHNGVMAGDF